MSPAEVARLFQARPGFVSFVEHGADALGDEVSELNKALRRTHSLEDAAVKARDPELALAFLRAADKVI